MHGPSKDRIFKKIFNHNFKTLFNLDDKYKSS